MNDISVILNVYNRPYSLEKQLEAIKNQTIPIKDENIIIWYNKGTSQQSAPKNKNHKIFVCNHNTKFHGRFTAALLAKTKYVAMFDDDVIPGKRWFENCMKSIQTQWGIYGGSGVILQSNTYQPNNKIGWNGFHHNEISRVDLVGHAWFFKQEWAKYMWYEEPVSWENGEDIMFSYLCQKYGGINTFVPPHSDNDLELWSNIPGKDEDWGNDKNATWLHNPTHFSIRDSVVTTCIEQGWRTVKNIQPKKIFTNDFIKFQKKIEKGENFALSRNNDGEMIILNNQYINLLEKCNGEFIYDPTNETHKKFRERLLDSARYRDKNYYVGIACRCCVGDEKHEELKKLTNQDEEHLTWGNIFVNGNYYNFMNKILPIFNDRDIILICNKKANYNLLPFSNKIKKVFTVGTNAWMEDDSLTEEISDYVLSNQIKSHIFLIAAGPFSNILIHELYTVESQNTYLDIGSTLDNLMGLGATRGYLAGAPTLEKICIW